MPILTLENNWLKASFKTLGAELCSLIEKSANTEHIWQADPAVWNRHAPVLFPIVGQVENSTYSVSGIEYKMSQHGFARDKEFTVELQTADSIIFMIESNAEILKVYPYKFRLFITYTLNLNKLEINYKVVNTDSQKIFFSIGAHPGFVCPFTADESFSDYVLEFQKRETASRLLFSAGLLNGEKHEEYLKDSASIPLSYELFQNDAIILEGLKSDYVDLKSRKTGRSMRFNFKGFPLLAFWTKPGVNASFLCIEPWYGVADAKGANKDFTEKAFIESLEIGEHFESLYSLMFIS